MSINWNLTNSDREIVEKIASRAVGIIAEYGNATPEDQIQISMDITACHLNGCPLDLQRMLEADDFNLLHDLVGLKNHISHKDGSLTGHFRPRFAAKVAA